MTGDNIKADGVSGLFWLATGLIGMYGSVTLGIGAAREPGSGFLPFFSSVFISVMALTIFIQSFLVKGQRNPRSFWHSMLWKRPVAIIIILVLYILVFKRAGFLISSFLFMLTILKYVEGLSWRKSVLISALSSGLSYSLFKLFLKVELPAGLLGI